MTDLRTALLAHAVAELSPKASSQDISAVLEHLQETLPEFHANGTGVAATARDISAGRLRGHRCRVMGTVAAISKPRMFLDTTDATKTRREYVTVTLVDTKGEEVPALQVVDEELAAALLAASESGTAVLVDGLGLELPELSSKAKEWGIHGVRKCGKLIIEHVSTTYTHLDAIAATVHERENAEESLLKASGNIRRLLTDSLINHMGVVRGSYLDELVELVVVQSMGTGTIGTTSGTLHLFLIGPPGHGKKLVGEAAAILNPTFSEVMPGRTTVPGLTGMARGKFGGGALSRASGGVTNIQDAHAYTEAELKALAPVLQHVMEDGEVRIGGMAGGQTMTARTGLLIDSNRSTELQGRGLCPPIMDQLPLTTRFDFIMEIDLDPMRSWEIGSKILSTGTTEANVSNDWKRRLQVVVAVLRDRHPVVDIRPVEAQLTEGYKQLADDFGDFFRAHPVLSASVPRRMAVSLKKITCAAARSEGRGTAESEDAVFALEWARRKLTFIRNHVVQLSTCPSTAPDPSSWLKSKSGVFNAQDLAEEYEEHTGHQVSPRTMRRRLVHMGAKQAGKGLYRLEGPPPPPTREALLSTVSTVGSSAIAHRAAERDTNQQGQADRPGVPKSVSNDSVQGGVS